MKKVFLLFFFVLGACLLKAQDTISGPTGGSFPVTIGNLFDLIDIILAWAIGIALGRWRQVLQVLSTILPFLRTFVNDQDKRAALNILKKREARLLLENKKNDLRIEAIDTLKM